MTARDLQTNALPQSTISGPQPSVKPCPNYFAIPKRHPTYAVFSWNSGGLSYELFMDWISNKQFDVLIVLETQWKFTGEWSKGSWHFLHNGAAHAGVLIAISRKVCRADQIAFDYIIPGR